MTIGSLKQQLEERWAIPVAFQSLTLEAQVLNNNEQLGNCSAPNATNIFMHMVVSLDRAPEELRNPDPQMCLKALTFITHAAQTIDAEITTAVTARALEDSDRDVLNGASEALARIAERDNAQAIAGVTARLEDHN